MNKLYIVGTPIGNLKDITLRALDTLKLCEYIACEDTRTTRKLLNHYEIKNKKLISYHDKNEKFSSKGLIELVQNGFNVAVVSDAGMPVMSDPGFIVIKEAKETKIDYEIIPGVCAHVTAATLSSFDFRYKFIGFLNAKTGKRKNELKKLNNGVYATYVSPYKLISTLEDVKEIYGESTKVFLAKELTKLNETHYEGSVVEIIETLNKLDAIKGEYTLIFEVKNAK